MNAILILLGMFSLTLLVSNLSFLKRNKSVSYISIPIIFGFVFSPNGFIPILPSTLEDLSWALRVALTWVTFIAGTRLVETAINWQQAKKLIPFFVGYLLFFGLIFLMSEVVFSRVPMSFGSLFSFGDFLEPELLAIALILSSALFSSKENPFLLLVLFVSLLLLSGSETAFTYLDHVYPLSIGLLLGVVCRLVISPTGELDTPTRLALVGLCILGTGLAVGMECLEVLVGLAFGWSVAIFHRHGVYADPKLKATEAPVGFAVAFFSGLYLTLDPTVIFIGISAALIRFLLKWIIIKTGFRAATNLEVLTQIVPISHLALPVIISIHLSDLNGGSTAFLLNCFCVGFITNDLLALIITSLNKDQREDLYEEEGALS